MWSTAREIAAGDLIIVWLTRESLQPLVVTPGKEFNGKFGVYRHSDLVGVPYGSKVGSRNGKGFIHVLRPTPELWTMALPHRTQILYLADIAFVVSYLNIRPGSRVIEAGTGSGSFSHSVARTIGPSGHLYSYEFHEVRASKARDEFRSHGLADIITLTHRNVCKDGFTVNNEVDSVFLDLPAPWDAVEHARKALRKDRMTRICCFSPCMEQVLRTVSALNEAGFTDITMYETLLRPHEVHTLPVLQKVGEIGDKLKKAELRREVKRLKQVAASQAKRDKVGKKRKRAGQGEEGAENEVGREDANPMDMVAPTETSENCADTKKLRTDAADYNTSLSGTGFVDAPMMGDASEFVYATVMGSNAEQNSTSMDAGRPQDSTSTLADHRAFFFPEPSPSPPSIEPAKMVVSKVTHEVRGHTSYLTFAVLLPTEFSRENPDLMLDVALAQTINGEKNKAIAKDQVEPSLTEAPVDVVGPSMEIT